MQSLHVGKRLTRINTDNIFKIIFLYPWNEIWGNRARVFTLADSFYYHATLKHDSHFFCSYFFTVSGK